MIDAILSGNAQTILLNLMAGIIVIFIALPLHEVAHGFVARLLGDPTAERMGRLTLNPLAHLDPIGSLMILFVGFGWAKPVPINTFYFKNRNNGMALVSLAGPLTNLLIATLALLIYKVLLYFVPINDFIILLCSVLALVAQINISLCAFNLIPIPPLDGSKIIGFFLPMRWYYRYEQFFLRYQQYVFYGMVLILFVLPRMGGAFGVISNIIDIPFNWLWDAMFWIADNLTIFIDLIAKAVYA